RVRGGLDAGRPDGRDHRPARGPALPLAHRFGGRASRAKGDAAGVRPRGAVHQGGRQRPGGGPGRDPGRAAGVRRGRPRLGPDPRAERERGHLPAPAGGRSVGVPVGRASRRGPEVTPLDSLALSRGTVDRLTERRADPAWLDAAWAEPGTRVLVVSDGQALARIDDDQALLLFVPPDQAPAGSRFLLGQDEADGARPAPLREVGTLLGDRDAGLLTHAVALANWHDTHTHCPIDGTPTVPGPGGHFTVCPA